MFPAETPIFRQAFLGKSAKRDKPAHGRATDYLPLFQGELRRQEEVRIVSGRPIFRKPLANPVAARL